jgi:ABC-type lipoprotein export system ATPase subunit
MMDAGPPAALEMRGVVKRYHGLRPLRVASLLMQAGERVSIGGVDPGAGELFVNLVTGATLPDEGEIRIAGQRTADISDSETWLASLDRFGIVTARGVLLEAASLLQNLALPFTLEIDPVPGEVVDRVEMLAGRCGIEPKRWLPVQAAAAPAEVRIRVHLARALALDPELVLVEDPTRGLERGADRGLAADMRRACELSRATVLILTDDEPFARRASTRALRLRAATGELSPLGRGWLRW